MAVHIDVTYKGDLHCVALHQPSQNTLPTDAPVDNKGKGRHFSPTDLLATALGTCMLTTMGIVAEKHQINMEGAQAHVVKEMGAQPKRYVGRLVVHIQMPAHIPEESRSILQEAAETCPVALSLSDNTQIELDITYV
jgi:putative redox protein